MAGLSTNLDMFLIMRQFGDLKNFNHLFEVIISKIPYELSEEDRSKLKDFSRRVINIITKKWSESSRSLKTFLTRENNKRWLESDIQWPTCDSVDLNVLFGDCADVDEENQTNFSSSIVESVPSTSTAEASTSTEKISRVPFQDLCNKQKKRRSDSTMSEKNEEELFYCFTEKLKANGKAAFAKILEHLEKYPDTIPSVSEFLFIKKKQDIPEDKSLAVLTALNLSKWQYLTLRGLLKEENSANLPSYQKIMKSKQRCYPPDDFIEVTERGASIGLQALLDHTVQRILLDLGPILSEHPLKLMWKWGLDGSSSQSNYKQKSIDPDFKDSSVVMISAVPLRLINEEGSYVWENPNPCSTQYCRPVKFTFTAETAEFIQTEHLHMQQEISELVPTKCDLVEIVHELHMTMIDGKVANTVAGVSSSATCPICLAKPSEMNNLDHLATKPVREDLYQYGISSLHMRIRCMECLLHISYNQDFERWTARGENKELKQAKKSLIQKEFREEAGILIDIVKQGFGTTNDGNTARHFFLHYEMTARITGIDENLIFRFSIILQAVCSGKKINVEAFRSYCRETAEMFVHLYPWYHMPVSVHKLLIHGADICSHFSVLPIGILSEEASEARNKDFRNTRRTHTRKTGRIATNEDILHGLLVSSDPHISRIRPKISKLSHQDLFPEAAKLIILDETDLINVSLEEEESLLIESENISDPLA